MNYKYLLAIAFWGLLFAVSCQRDDISFESPTQELRFSADTVFCDTVYNQVRSETYAVKVYNDEGSDIMIPKITLRDGSSSLYRINVDGQSGFEFNNVPLRKKDSLYIFVEIAPSIAGSRLVADDEILFDLPNGQQHVTLFSTVQDAEFFVESPTNHNIISGNVTWTNDKAKLIYGELTLAPGAALTIEKGTYVYFTKNSGMKVSSGAQLNIIGDLDEEVTIRGDRNDPKYDTIPKNWNQIEFEPNSNLNMNYARIYGGTNGIKLQEATANITNSIFYSFQEHGIFAINSTINASNLVMNNCGIADFGIYKGGNYNLTHATLANYWPYGVMSGALALFASNDWTNEDGQTESAGLSLKLKNSIFYTSGSNSIKFEPNSGQTFSYLMQNCLTKYESSVAGYQFDGNSNIINSISNLDALFINRFIAKMNLRVDGNSPAKNAGDLTVAASVPLDIKKNIRTSNPTLGAYQ